MGESVGPEGLSPVVGQNHKTPPGPLITFWSYFNISDCFLEGREGGPLPRTVAAFRSKTAAGLCSAAAARLHSAWKGAGQNKK